ncbi:MAG: sigma-54-dependent Fis family transcriptional regulator [Myxococcaceae bacterium]|nr:MAG: sigma-54-dependent Fis family transcriptional regulator [Myxococcaceae bacterium]
MSSGDVHGAVESAAPRVLLIEDDLDVAEAVTPILAEGGRRQIEHAPTARVAREALALRAFDAVVLDLSLPDADGFGLLEEIAAEFPGVGILCFTGRDDASAAVRALRAGATDYITKPAPAVMLRQAVDGAVTRARLRQPRLAAGGVQTLPIGSSPPWRQTMDLIAAAARSPKTTVLITGEPGVGKEEAAALVHRLSARRDGPFVAVNAACLSPSMIESELFGHEVGAFTGAHRQHRGFFEQASGGTLLLDEIGELPLELQAKLLRVLERHPFRRVGGEKPIAVDVRLLCATNRSLDERVRAGAFRADLLERLRVFELRLPPLRERPGDVARLAHHFIARLGPELGIPVEGFSPLALEALAGYAFPGNVRELRNITERAIVLSGGGIIERRHLPAELRAKAAASVDAAPARSEAASLEEVVREHILRVYEGADQNVTRTAQVLGMSRLAVRKRLQSYGVRARGVEDIAVDRNEDDR